MPCCKQRQWMCSNHSKHNWCSFWWSINFIVPKKSGLMIFHWPTLIIYPPFGWKCRSVFNRCPCPTTFCVITPRIGAPNLHPRISLEALHDFLSRLAIINRRTTPEDYVAAVQPPGGNHSNTPQTGVQQNARELDWKMVWSSTPKMESKKPQHFGKWSMTKGPWEMELLLFKPWIFDLQLHSGRVNRFVSIDI